MAEAHIAEKRMVVCVGLHDTHEGWRDTLVHELAHLLLPQPRRVYHSQRWCRKYRQLCKEVGIEPDAEY